MSGHNFNAPHRLHFVRAGTYDIEIHVTRLFEVVPIEGEGREANGSEATIFTTVTGDSSFKVCRELTRFAGHVTHVGTRYTRTVRFVMEKDGMLALTVLHDPMTVFEWGAVVKPALPERPVIAGECLIKAEDPADKVEAAIASHDFWVQHRNSEEPMHVFREGLHFGFDGIKNVWSITDVRRFFRERVWVLVEGVPAALPEPDPATLQGAAELAARAKQKWLDAKALSKKLRAEADEAMKATHAAHRAFGDAARNLVKVAGADSEED